MTDQAASAPFFATSFDEMPKEADIAALSGLDFIRAIRDGLLPAPPIGRLMNMRLTDADPGRVVFESTPDFDHHNPIGGVHGGWFGALLDSCMSCAVQTLLPAGSGYTTLEYKVNMLRPVLAGMGPFRAIGTADHVGRRTGIATGRLEGPDGKLHATGSATCLVLELAGAPA